MMTGIWIIFSVMFHILKFAYGYELDTTSNKSRRQNGAYYKYYK